MATNPASSWKRFRLEDADAVDDWIADVDLDSARMYIQRFANRTPPKILVLYGSLRKRAISKLLAYEFARVLEYLGAEVRVFDPSGLPMLDEERESKHPKVVEIKALFEWSESQMWVSPEQHNTISSVFKNTIDWIRNSVTTQGKTLGLAVCGGGGQSFNALTVMRVMGRALRMVCIPNQAMVPSCGNAFSEEPSGRVLSDDNKARIVDVAEELFKFTLLTRAHNDILLDRFSEREAAKAKAAGGIQAEKQAKLAAQEAKEAKKLAAITALPLPARAARVFKRLDSEDTGEVSYADLVLLLRAAGESEKQANTTASFIVNGADVDGDRSVSLSEFVKLVEDEQVRPNPELCSPSRPTLMPQDGRCDCRSPLFY